MKGTNEKHGNTRIKMVRIDEFICNLDSELLSYAANRIITEMDIRSELLQKEHNKKQQKRWLNWV